jgi:hypothetical protein
LPFLKRPELHSSPCYQSKKAKQLCVESTIMSFSNKLAVGNSQHMKVVWGFNWLASQWQR